MSKEPARLDTLHSERRVAAGVTLMQLRFRTSQGYVKGGSSLLFLQHLLSLWACHSWAFSGMAKAGA